MNFGPLKPMLCMECPWFGSRKCGYSAVLPVAHACYKGYELLARDPSTWSYDKRVLGQATRIQQPPPAVVMK